MARVRVNVGVRIKVEAQIFTWECPAMGPSRPAVRRYI